jgi:PAS domain S-box-containing protein
VQEAGSLHILHQALLGEAVMGGESAVFVSDDVGRYLAVNDAAIRLLGYAREEFAKLNARDVTERTEEELAEVMAMLRRRRSIQQTARLRRKDGVVGEIDYVGLESVVGGLPVIVSVTAPIDTFRPLGSLD